MNTPEQEARDMLERMGIEHAQNWNADWFAELTNLIAEVVAHSAELSELPAVFEPLTEADRPYEGTSRPIKSMFETTASIEQPLTEARLREIIREELHAFHFGRVSQSEFLSP